MYIRLDGLPVSKRAGPRTYTCKAAGRNGGGRGGGGILRDLFGEQHIGGFGLPVRRPIIVLPASEVQVIKLKWLLLKLVQPGAD